MLLDRQVNWIISIKCGCWDSVSRESQSCKWISDCYKWRRWISFLVAPKVLHASTFKKNGKLINIHFYQPKKGVQGSRGSNISEHCSHFLLQTTALSGRSGVCLPQTTHQLSVPWHWRRCRARSLQLGRLGSPRPAVPRSYRVCRGGDGQRLLLQQREQQRSAWDVRLGNDYSGKRRDFCFVTGHTAPLNTW